MSGSDWGNTDKNRLIKACVIAFLFIAAFSAWGYCFQSGYYKQAAEKSAQYQRWADDEIRQRCGNRPDIFREKCERKANHTAHENKRNEYDLYAQRTSALWAGIMAIAALFGIGLSGVGVWLVKATFDETREGNKIAAASQRAWITVSISLTTSRIVSGQLQIRYRVEFRNTGNTAAQNFWAEQKLFLSGGDFGNPVSQWQEKTRTKEKTAARVIMPNETYILDDKKNIKLDDVAWLGRPYRRFLVISASAFYFLDGGGKRRHTERTFLITTEDVNGRVQDALHRSRLSQIGPVDLHIREAAPRHAS